MNTTERLAFRLLIAEPNTDERTVTVCPRYDGLKLKWSRPSGQMYYTEDISGTLKFTGVDFKTLHNCALHTQFILIVYQNRVEVGRSLFRKTDCKWDIDHGIVDVDISVYDEYKKFQDKKDEEYNLVRLGLEKRVLNLNIYPTRQIYFLTDKEMHYYRSDPTSTRVIVEEQDSMRSLIDDMYFGGMTSDDATKLRMVGLVRIESSPWSGYDQYYGVYYSTTNTFTAVSGETRRYQQWLYKDGDTSSSHKIRIYVHSYYDGNCAFRIDLFNGSSMIAKTGINSFTEYDNSNWGNNYLQTARATNLGLYFNDGNIAFIGQGRFYFPLSRIASALEIGDAPNGSHGIKSEDILYMGPGVGNYKTVHSLPNTILAFSTRTSETPTEYGRVENTDYYYDKPTDDDIWSPVYKESWFSGYSLWLADNSLSQSVIDNYTSSRICHDFYLLTDAIRAVAQKIDPDIQFDSDDSAFLFNAINPLNGVQQGSMYISQKSNILNLGYDYPAWLAPVKWSQIETLLREAFDCYWSIYDTDGQKHLRIEHRKWYENGGKYTQDNVQVATIDLTSTFRNGTSFTFGENTRHWEFDTDGNGTVSTASRHEYGWMDTQSEIFNGQPITVPEAYRLFTDEKVEQHKVDWFSSDIDFLASVQAECSSDGFALVMENPNNPNWIIAGAPQYIGQNYQLSFDYLQEKYLLQGIYAEYIKIGENETLTATGSNARLRTSEVQMRVPNGMTIEASDTIKTKVGIGVIDTLEYDMHSELYTAKLRYENE